MNRFARARRRIAAAGAVVFAAAAVVLAPAAPAFAATTGWIDQCPTVDPATGVAHTNNDDPIVFPGQQNVTHLHDYNGNLSANYASTYASMTAAGTSCPAATQDTAGYWFPSILENGTPVTPCTSPNSASPRCTNYYRDDNLTAAYLAAHPPQPFPAGFKMIAGNSHATSVTGNSRLGRELYYGCSDNSETGKPVAPVNCSTGIMTIHVGFPDCWSGTDATTTTGGYNAASDTGAPAADQTLAYPSSGVCPAGFPNVLPRVIERAEITVGTNAASSITLSSGATYTLHGDFWNTWQQTGLATLVSRCLDAGTDCGNDPTP